MATLRAIACSGVPRKSAAVGVPHPEESLPDVGKAHARSAQIARPDCVVLVFQVKRYSPEPFEPILACNLLAKDDCRAAEADEPEEVRPEVSLVINPSSTACRGERLARATSRPNGPLIVPPGETQGSRPSADAGEEVALRVAAQIVRSDIRDTPFIHVAGGNFPHANEFA
jgi:hypothetical protein